MLPSPNSSAAAAPPEILPTLPSQCRVDGRRESGNTGER